MKKRFSIICYYLNKKIPNPSKAKEYYEPFSKNKAKKNPKASKTVKNLNNSDIRSVLKPIKQSNITTQEPNTVENPNIFDIESVYCRTFKNCYQIIKVHKTTKNYYSTVKHNKNLYIVKSH